MRMLDALIIILQYKEYTFEESEDVIENYMKESVENIEFLTSTFSSDKMNKLRSLVEEVAKKV